MGDGFFDVVDEKTLVVGPRVHMIEPRSGYAWAQFPDGKIMVAGGYTTWPIGMASIEVFDPSQGKFFRSACTLPTPISEASAVALGGSTVLVTSSQATFKVDIENCEATSLEGPPHEQSIASLHTLPSGLVFVSSKGTPVIYDPSCDTFKIMPGSIYHHDHNRLTTTMLPTGRALVVGASYSTYVNDSAELSPSLLSFKKTGCFKGTTIDAKEITVLSDITKWSGGISYVDEGDWLHLGSVDFGNNTSPLIFSTSVATPHAGNHVEVRVGSIQGEIVADLTLAATGTFSNATAQSASFLRVLRGPQDLWITFNGSANRRLCEDNCWRSLQSM